MERWLLNAERRKAKPSDELPLALAREGPHGPVVHALNPAARTLGLIVGARVVDMRALCPDLLVRDADLAGDLEALDRFGHWVRRWAPWSAVEEMDGGTGGIALETTGSDHLWGGEAAMLADMEARFGSAGLSVRLAIAPTRGGAWALARHGHPAARICPEGGLEEWLSPLPVEALRLDPATVLLLRRLGLRSIGKLIPIPRAALARRFGQDGSDLPLRLDQALGRLSEPLASLADPARHIARIDLADTVQDPVPHLPALAHALCDRLRHDGLGLRRMCLRLFRVDGEVRSVTLTCARASRDAAHLVRLFDGRLDGMDPGHGFDLLTLEAMATEPLGTTQSHLYEGEKPALPLPDLIDRLTARFGPHAVTWPLLRESHLPERAETVHEEGNLTPSAPGEAARLHPHRPSRGPIARVRERRRLPTALARPTPLRHKPDVPDAGLPASPRVRLASRGERPLRLFAPPEEIRVIYAIPEGPPMQFVWRRRPYRVSRQQGPERIAPEWWQDRPGTRLRDYFRIEVMEGSRFWIFREGLMSDGRGGPPRWFLHGVFA
jgi:protein ImuB